MPVALAISSKVYLLVVSAPGDFGINQLETLRGTASKAVQAKFLPLIALFGTTCAVGP